MNSRELAKILIHYRTMHRYGDLTKWDWKNLYNELKILNNEQN